MKRIAIALLATGSLAAADPATAAAAAPGPLAPHPYEAFLGARIQRTMTLLATSTQIQRNPVRVLFYGQSIVAGGHVARAFTAWAAKAFPHAKVEIENRAIGGYTAPTLVRTARQDVVPFYPDLVCFHVYDGHDSGELERIVSDIRRFTTAEILMWTHHQDHYGPDGSERDKSRDDASTFRRMLAQKYNAELVEVREEWKQRLLAAVPPLRSQADSSRRWSDLGAADSWAVDRGSIAASRIIFPGLRSATPPWWCGSNG